MATTSRPRKIANWTDELERELYDLEFQRRYGYGFGSAEYHRLEYLTEERYRLGVTGPVGGRY